MSTSETTSAPAPGTLRIAWLPGDGIGREVTAAALGAARPLLADAGVDLVADEHAIGGAALDACGDAFPVIRYVLFSS